jgi:alanine dehydrogenase
VPPGKVVIIGAGNVGSNALAVADGIGATVTVYAKSDRRLAALRTLHPAARFATGDPEIGDADLVIGGVLTPGQMSPKLITRAMLRAMRRGSALVDVGIDQGGIAETSRPTSHSAPAYVEEGVVHYCVTNMPAMVPHTSTYALTNATLTYALEIADHGILEAGALNSAIRHGLNIFDGQVAHPAVAEVLKMEPQSPWD